MMTVTENRTGLVQAQANLARLRELCREANLPRVLHITFPPPLEFIRFQNVRILQKLCTGNTVGPEVYMQEIPASVQSTINSIHHELRGLSASIGKSWLQPAQ